MPRKRRRKKRKLRLNELIEKLKEPMKIRTGVQPTKVIPDKTKYNRKQKHKKDPSNED